MGLILRLRPYRHNSRASRAVGKSGEVQLEHRRGEARQRSRTCTALSLRNERPSGGSWEAIVHICVRSRGRCYDAPLHVESPTSYSPFHSTVWRVRSPACSDWTAYSIGQYYASHKYDAYIKSPRRTGGRALIKFSDRDPVERWKGMRW